MAHVYVGIGSNVERETNVLRAIRTLSELQEVDRISTVYETDAVGPTPQPPFWNLALRFGSDAPPETIARELRRLEETFGRRRGDDRYAPRTLDLDLLLYDDLLLRTPDLTLPHPQVLEQAFVLVPLAEIAPELRHPAEGLTIAEIRRRLPLEPIGVRALPELEEKVKEAWRVGRERSEE